MTRAFCLLVLLAAAASGQPPNISGQYSFLHEGEFLQLAVQGDSVSGLVSRLGEGEFDRGVVLDHAITSGSLRAGQLSFATKEIHAVSFEFAGRIQRGPARSRAEEGFYLLAGTLKRHTSDAEHRERLESREVTFKSQPE
jgi:hypothetical protein